MDILRDISSICIEILLFKYEDPFDKEKKALLAVSENERNVKVRRDIISLLLDPVISNMHNSIIPSYNMHPMTSYYCRLHILALLLYSGPHLIRSILHSMNNDTYTGSGVDTSFKN